ncbi:MAG: TRAP transporter small permease [Alphaproteobacteria bacterium]|jgi:TRAP-type C4-dicarboxylate transport system permease small subunit|nr:TRAP transporter small permease [Alphaproteobacteria bacterium]
MPAARLIERLSMAAAWLAAATFFAIGLIVTYEVAMRYLFLAPTRWAEETSRVLQVYAVFLACAWLVGRREHIRITVVTALLPPGAQIALARLSLVVIALVAAVAAWYGAVLMQFSIAMGQYTDSTLELPMWLLQAPVAAGLALVAAQAIATFALSLSNPEILVEHRRPSQF